MKKKTLLLWMIVITSQVNAQSYEMRIYEKDGNQIIVTTETITKMTFALDQTHALLVSQKNGSQIKSIITGINKITFNELTHIEENNEYLKMNIKTFVLYQNYPNPFNSFTAISYQLSAFSHVEISIYDVLGKKIKTLAHQNQDAGCYKIDFNASDLESGIYFYQLRAGEFVQTKKMLFVK